MALPGTDVNPAGRAPARLAVHCNLATGGPGAAMPHAPFGRPRRPLGTFPRGESTSSARRRTKPPTRNRLLMDGKEKMLPCFFRFTEGFASAEATKGLSGRPLETFGPMLRMGISTRNEMFPCFSRFAGFRLCGGDQRAFRSPFGNLRPLCRGWEFSQEMDCAKLSINSKKRASQAFPPAWHAFILPLFLSHPAPVAQLPPCLPPRWWHDAVPASPATAAPAAAPAHR